jgi:hypothetical protein
MKIISSINAFFYIEMKKDFIVSKIEAPQDGSHYVLVAFTDPNTTVYLTGRLNENLPKIISSMFGGGDSPTFKITMKEYKDMAIKVGDKVMIEIKKADNSGV